MQPVWILLGLCIVPIGESAAQHITLLNATSMPVVAGPKAGICTITSTGPVTRIEGENIRIIQKEPLHDK